MGNVIMHYAQWLFDPKIVRIIYSGEKKRWQLEYADLVVAAESYLKPFPLAEIQQIDQLVNARKLVLPDLTKQYSFQKDNILFYPAVISRKKGQLDAAQLLDPALVSRFNLSLIFVGNVVNETYWQQVRDVLESKSIPYQYLGYLENQTVLNDLYVRSRVIVHYPTVPVPGPKMVYQGLFANTPFLTSDYAQLDFRIGSLGGAIVGKRSIVNATVEMIEFNTKLEYVLTNTWSNAPRLLAKKLLSFEGLFAKIDCLLSSKRKL